jgi:lipocalin
MQGFKIMVAHVMFIFALLPASGAELEVVPSVDLNRYAGKWYEIARLPNRFQNQCAGNVTANYAFATQLAERAQRQGFDTDRLIRTRHD